MAGAVHVGCVKKIDAEVYRFSKQIFGFEVVRWPVKLGHSHATEANGRDFNASFTKLSFFHGCKLIERQNRGKSKFHRLKQATGWVKEAIQIANEMGVTVSTDLNFRKNLWKYGKSASEVMPALVAGCDIILANEEDAEMVFGIKPEGFDVAHTGGEVNSAEFESVCTQIMAKFPRANKVIITLRGSINANHNTWGGVLYSNGTLYQSKRYDITHIVDRVGGGDSFMGGLVYGLLTYTQDDQTALEFAVAASCLKHTIYGDYNLATVAEVVNLMGGDGSGRVSR